MEGAEGWDKNYLNGAMLELLRIDCQATARRIETDPAYRWMVQNKMFSSWLRESTSAVAYTAVLYASMLAASNVPGKRVEDTVDEETKEAVDQEGGSEADLGQKLDYLFGKGTGRKHNIERSKAMKVELSKIGIHDTPSGRQYLSEHFNNVLKDPSNISKIENHTYTAKELSGTPVVEYTATIRESLLMGPGGALEIESVWIDNRLITVIIKGGQ